MVRAAREVGFDVAVGTRVRKHGPQLAAEGLRIVPISFVRGRLGPVSALVAINNLIAIIRSERPDVVHCVGLPMCVLGGLAARISGIKKIILAPTGLGHLWTSTSMRTRLLRGLVKIVLGKLSSGEDVHFIFENREDPLQFRIPFNDPRLTIIRGAGVDPNAFQFAEEPPAPPVKIAVVCRMVRTKGVEECVRAARLAIMCGANIELHLFGTPDPSNPVSFTAAELSQFSKQDGIFWHGWTDDISKVWRNHHIAMLLSYREGLPVSLVEAAACGRPMIAADAVGCREVVRHGVNGYLVPVKDVVQAAARLHELSSDSELRRQMGAAANESFNAEFTTQKVRETVTGLYRRLIS